MGYIDCDAHLFETEETWSYLDPGEREFRPTTLRDERTGVEWWCVGSLRSPRRDRNRALSAKVEAAYDSLYPTPDVHILADIPARLGHMDRLGVDVQILFSTYFIGAVLDRPIAEAALARSYNRWIAERCAESHGRIRWAMVPPLRMMNRAVDELTFAKENGAAGVHMHDLPLGMVLDDEYFDEFYAKAQDLDLPMLIHVGGDSRVAQADRRGNFRIVTGAVTGFYRLLAGSLHEKFPRLRWAVLEAGASWLPFVLSEASRFDDSMRRNYEDPLAVIDRRALSERELFVACQINDDLPYIADFVGADSLVVGTDYTHFDVGSDVGACGIIASRTDIKPELARRITDVNGRRLYGIDEHFVPADRAKTA